MTHGGDVRSDQCPTWGRTVPTVYDARAQAIYALEAEVERLVTEIERLREDYKAMRLEWSKSVDERDEAIAEIKRLRVEVEAAKTAAAMYREQGEALRGEAGIRDRAYAEGERAWKAEVERLRETQSTLTSVRVWAEIVEARHSDERVQRFARMLLDLLDGDAPDITASTTEGEQ